ncbi:peroxisome biogenesis protein 2 isoform X2 [Nicotiana tabacum]|uniref:Peroxisome biogenesis protein 2 isoform X2 n=1 Tax=Nicotiana tabacum TaxID=4097 RepID=A0AC58USL8_TOBAC
MSAMLKSGMLFQYESELDAFLEFLIWRFSIRVDKPTPGNALMNLRYRDERAVEVRGKVACRYRNIIERALRARLVYWSPHMNRTVSFEYMNLQLVWNEFSDCPSISRVLQTLYGHSEVRRILMTNYLRIYVCNFSINYLLGYWSLTLSKKGKGP